MYKSWAATFYPEGTRDLLAYYATRFATLEINATFYRLPTVAMVESWRARAPAGFVFAVKAPRAVTHYKRLLPDSESFVLFLERIAALQARLGPVLWQLPPNFGADVERLDAFLSTLPPWMQHAFEFRHASWFCEPVYDVLRRHGAALVGVSSLRFPMQWTPTADFAYVRFHGLEGGAAHDYTGDELRPWADHLRAWARSGHDAYVYFNNDVNTRAPLNAEALREMVGPNAVQPASVEDLTRRHEDTKGQKRAPH